jgi:hypothetical protein
LRVSVWFSGVLLFLSLLIALFVFFFVMQVFVFGLVAVVFDVFFFW